MLNKQNKSFLSISPTIESKDYSISIIGIVSTNFFHRRKKISFPEERMAVFFLIKFEMEKCMIKSIIHLYLYSNTNWDVLYRIQMSATDIISFYRFFRIRNIYVRMYACACTNKLYIFNKGYQYRITFPPFVPFQPGQKLNYAASQRNIRMQPLFSNISIYVYGQS